MFYFFLFVACLLELIMTVSKAGKVSKLRLDIFLCTILDGNEKLYHKLLEIKKQDASRRYAKAYLQNTTQIKSLK